MTPSRSLILAAAFACALSVGYAWLVRLPYPFPGFAILVAMVFAFAGTVAIACWMPRRWIWTDAELLTMAFQDRHNLSKTGAELALDAITTAHDRASNLRSSASVMRDDMAEKVGDIADRFDAAAREIFYEPDRARDLRAVLVRSELIEEAAGAHAALRRRRHAETEAASREKLLIGLAALEVAFDQTDLFAARGHLHDVSIASDVAENLLMPRQIKRLQSEPNKENSK